ncbi:hypothetical protein GCM10010112_64770 [Actinoplanes lobatus]|uniref:Uncharacterized protein n=1 Tax=Actinoplanes lobatus TaxID=113568 RepID=A0ABQ4AAN7_9ACTN|nr:hypothetical protein GCM10010112_64770 [Actinoplanes lobatus]GIE38066.1 hypothetical protein Alo02nite_09640 [Actinoplanes lobatus]
MATDVIGNLWEVRDDPLPENRPPDTWITFTTAPDAKASKPADKSGGPARLTGK